MWPRGQLVNAVADETSESLPFLKWAGGKRWLAHGHRKIFPNTFKCYLEPFLGSGAVFFKLRPHQALLADINAELINTYRVIRDDWQGLARRLRVHSRRHSDDYYYEVRSCVPRDEVHRAARIVYLNRTCWNGLYRVNRKGEFNVPRGTKDTVLLETDDFERISELLQAVRLEVWDFEKTIDSAGPDDLIFADPPYTVKHNNNGFIKYNDTIFSWDDQVRLRDALCRAHTRGVRIVATNANHESIRDLYKDFAQDSLSRASVLAGQSRARGSTEELLMRNF